MSKPLLVVENLSKSFAIPGSAFGRAARAHAVARVSFAIEKGRTFGLIGESGSGKTTLARLMVRLTEPDEGTLLFDGKDLCAMSGRALREVRRRIQIVAQDSIAAFDPRIRVRSAIVAPIRLHRLCNEQDMPGRLDAVLDQVGLPPDLLDRFPHQLSGGQLQRLGIARALAMQPDIIILDEVASALDVLAKAQILRLLKDLQRSSGVTFVFISHNIADVALMADTVGVLFGGRIVELGDASCVFGDPRHPYTRALLASANGRNASVLDWAPARYALSGAGANSGCPYADRCPERQPECRDSMPISFEIKRDTHLCACFRATEGFSTESWSEFRVPLSDAARKRLDLMIKANGKNMVERSPLYRCPDPN